MQIIKLITLILILSACTKNPKKANTTFTLAFGSCNNQDATNVMWREISKHKPDIWVWGGDIIYADNDSDDMEFIRANYNKQKNYPAYSKFVENTSVIGSWDDHDYGLNDGGVEFPKKVESQQIFLDFMGVAYDSPRRKQAGIYTSHDYQVGVYSIKVIVLDTRYFRTGLTDDPDPSPEKRFKPNKYGNGTILGDVQWQWLQDVLSSSNADFNVISSSIQFLSPYHGFEKWANMPHEVDKMLNTIKSSNAKNVLFLSGDRHISEFSKKQVQGLDYPLIDFTSSGINRALNRDKKEANPYRVGRNVTSNSFGVVRFDFVNNQITMEMRGKYNKILHRYVQGYSNPPIKIKSQPVKPQY